MSDSLKFKDKKAEYIKVNGLGLVSALHCPHYDVEKNRQKSLKDLMSKNSGVAIALENCSAIEIINNQYRIITSKRKVNAYRIYWQNKKYVKEKINQNKKFLPIDKLFSVK